MAQYKREAPQYAPDERSPVLVEIDANYIPLVADALAKYQSRHMWQSEADWVVGKEGVIRFKADLLSDMTAQITEAIDRLYRLWDTALNGTAYTSTGAGTPESPRVYNPPIPVVPPAFAPSQTSMRSHLLRLMQMGENMYNGVGIPGNSAYPGAPAMGVNNSWLARFAALQGRTDGFLGFGSQPVTLRDLLQAGRVNNATDEGLIADGIEEALQALSAGGNIGTVLSNLFGTAADVATDGGLAAILSVSAVANAATAAEQARITDELRAELRYLNETLTAGSPAAAPTVPVGPYGLLRGLLAFNDETGGPLVSTGVGEAVSRALRPLASVTTWEQLQVIAGATELTAQRNFALDGLDNPYTTAEALVNIQSYLDELTRVFWDGSNLWNGGVGGPITFRQHSAEVKELIRDLDNRLQLYATSDAARQAANTLLLQELLECSCPDAPGAIPPWSEVACEDDPLLTATALFSGPITAAGIVADTIILDSAPPNWAVEVVPAPGGDVVALAYEETQISACYVVAIAPGYGGSVAASISPIALDGIADPGRPTPADAAPGPTGYTHFGASSANSELRIAYVVGIAIGESDPPLDGSQVRVYFGRPDPTP